MLSQSEHCSETLVQVPTLLMTHFQLVGEFHDTFEHPQRKELYTDCFTSEPKLVPFRISLMREELNEFLEALTNNDDDLLSLTGLDRISLLKMKLNVYLNTLTMDHLANMADALCDLSYVANGAGQCLGIDIDESMKKLGVDITTNNIKDQIDLDTIKHKRDIIIYGVELLELTLSSFCLAVDAKNLSIMEYYLVMLIKHTYDFGHKLGFHMDNMFREVHRANMTKVCNTQEDVNASIEFYLKEGRYKTPAGKPKGDYFVVYDMETTKILKNYKWDEPNHKQFF
jgi:predicted HAD superfamily Cof-like phosphohydrolase